AIAGTGPSLGADRPEQVVALASLRVRQDLVRLVDLLELDGRLGLGVDVRMPLLGKLPVGLLDLGVGRTARHAQDLVVIADCHRSEEYGATIRAVPEPRLTVALTFDSDAISDAIRRGDSPVKLSHGEF